MARAEPQYRRPVSVIWNAAAGAAGGETLPERLQDLLGADGHEVRVVSADGGEELSRKTREELAGGAETVVAAGGDGTVSAVATLLSGTSCVLGVLPLGTLNHFARDLGIPTDLEGAAGVIREGTARAVDVGEVNGRIFLNNSSIGLYPALVRHRERQQERLGRGKWAALFWATVRVLRHHHSVTVRLQAEGQVRVLRTPLLFIGNNAYAMHGFEIGKRSRLDSGELSLYLTKRPGAWAHIRLALRALFGTLRESEDFEELRAREVRIETRHPEVRVAMDGEVHWLRSPLHFAIRPLALRVLAPAEGEGETATES
jgi:YegS/Rv2252/BmrU family lipid kinase